MEKDDIVCKRWRCKNCGEINVSKSASGTVPHCQNCGAEVPEAEQQREEADSVG